MNEFYAIFFLLLSILVMIKPFVKVLSSFIDSSQIKKLAIFLIIFGLFLIYYVINQPIWYERYWKVMTFVLGVIFLIRGLIIFYKPKLVKTFIIFYIKNFYKFSSVLSILMLLISSSMLFIDYLGPKKNINNCESSEQIDVICGVSNPEDIVAIPNTEFLLFSEFGGMQPFSKFKKESFLKILNTQMDHVIIPKLKFGKKTLGEENCNRDENDEFNLHGIDVLQKGKVIQVGAINHYPKETIEMFELERLNNNWFITWKGCISINNNVFLNDLSFKEDGTFYTTVMFDDDDITWIKWLISSIFKKDTGYIKYWDGKNFQILENSNGVQPNGIAFDKDNKLIYVAYNQGNLINIFDPIAKRVINSIYINSPDNITIDNNSIFVTELNHNLGDSPNCINMTVCSLPFSVIELSKEDLKQINKYEYSNTIFGLPTVAVPHNNSIYIGSFHSERIAKISLK